MTAPYDPDLAHIEQILIENTLPRVRVGGSLQAIQPIITLKDDFLYCRSENPECRCTCPVENAVVWSQVMKSWGPSKSSFARPYMWTRDHLELQMEF